MQEYETRIWNYEVYVKREEDGTGEIETCFGQRVKYGWFDNR